MRSDDWTPPVPSTELRRRFGVELDEELHGGHQSRVVRARLDDADIVVKLTDTRFTDGDHVHRLELVEHMASLTPFVVAPIRLDGNVANVVGDWSATALPLLEGRPPDLDRVEDVRAMGCMLAELHDAMAACDPQRLAPVAALRRLDDPMPQCDRQLLHGDFSDRNLILTDAGPRIIDFDDSGIGPIEFELGNTIYMVLFDSWVNDEPHQATAFRTAFIAAYRSASGCEIRDEAINAAVGIRISALRRWIDDLSSAPIGIRTASAEWRATLRAFVNAH